MLRSVPAVICILVLVAALLLPAGCSRKPLVAVDADSAPRFTDDLDLDSLKRAVRANIEYLGGQPSGRSVTLADRSFPLSRLSRSLEYFLEILESNPGPAELDRLVRQHYDIFQATGAEGFNPGRKVLLTAYFRPVLEGSATRQGPFQHPLYKTPPGLVRTENPDGSYSHGRRDGNKRAVYWTRKEIESGNKLAGQELVWLKDPFDAFILHVQGSGLIRLRDGSVRGVHYSAKNGHPYRSIGKYMVDTGRITLEEASMETIGNYIAAHPGEREEILHHNPSFIFFEWADAQGAIGNLGKELTAGRSIAVDQSCFPAGSLAFLIARKPVRAGGNGVAWNPMHRFVLVQDTGSAIRGPGRADLFWGTGDDAGFEAGWMKERGTLFFLVIKDESLDLIAGK